jgi:hypothetical protein
MHCCQQGCSTTDPRSNYCSLSSRQRGKANTDHRREMLTPPLSVTSSSRAGAASPHTSQPVRLCMLLCFTKSSQLCCCTSPINHTLQPDLLSRQTAWGAARAIPTNAATWTYTMQAVPRPREDEDACDSCLPASNGMLPWLQALTRQQALPHVELSRRLAAAGPPRIDSARQHTIHQQQQVASRTFLCRTC